MTATQLRWLQRAVSGGRLACLVWLVTAVFQIVFAEPAMADNCSVFTDCFGQTNSAAEATFGLALLSGLSLLLDFTPGVGDVKGIVEGVTGRDLLTGEELSAFDRATGMIPLIPAADVLRGMRGLEQLGDLARHADEGVDVGATVGRHGDEAEDALDAGRHSDDLGLAPGPRGEPPRGGGGGGDKPPPRGGGDPPPGGRDPDWWGETPEETARLDELARDPADGHKITEKTKQEARVAYDMEQSGRLPHVVRDPSGAADFMDPATGQLWDVKGFHSGYPTGARARACSSARRCERVGYDLNTAMTKIGDEISLVCSIRQVMRRSIVVGSRVMQRRLVVPSPGPTGSPSHPFVCIGLEPGERRHVADGGEACEARYGVEQPAVGARDALRHTHASLLLRDRVPIKVVSERLGHSNPRVHDDYLSARPAGDAGRCGAGLRNDSRQATNTRPVEAGNDPVEGPSGQEERPPRKMASHMPVSVGGGGRI